MPALSQHSLQRIARAKTVWLTTLRADGSPHVTPVWFVFDDETFWFATAEVTVKVRNLLSDARVALAIDGTTDAPIVAEGKAIIHHDPAPYRRQIELWSGKYDGWDPTDNSVDGVRVLVEVPVVRWLLRGT